MQKLLPNITYLLMITSCLAVAAADSPPARLNQPIPIDSFREEEPESARSRTVKNATRPNFSRQDVIDMYNTLYLPALAIPTNWSGSISGCNPGTTDPIYENATLTMINYFRSLVGLSAVTFDKELNAKAQKAALMMIAEGDLSHAPSLSWACYSADGAEAAGKSNLAIGNHGPSAIVGYIEDSGRFNTAVGHRRWILYPRQITMGSGSTDERKGWFRGSNALWIISSFGSRPMNPEWISWPPQTYVPYQLVYPRWSLSRNSSPGADFSKASVQMTRNGSRIPVMVLNVENGFGDNTLVWEPSDLSFGPAMDDQTITVTVSNIIIDGSPQTFSYDVTVIDPDNVIVSNDTIPPVISNCPSDIVQANEPGQCSAAVQWQAPRVSDNIKVASLTSSHNPGHIFFGGSTTVSYVAKDHAGNSATCSFDVTIVDTEAPVISHCPTNFTYVHTDGEIDPAPRWDAPMITDNCEVDTITSTRESGDVFPFGSSEITYWVTDESGNINSCTFTVEVTFSLNINRGWNLVSVPTSPGVSVRELFGDSLIGEVWAWDGQQYENVTFLEPYEGYWMYSRDKTQVAITGQLDEELNNDGILLREDWNLFGPITVVDQPYLSAITGGIWHWQNKQYTNVPLGEGVLSLGKAYWVKSEISQYYPR